MITSRSATGTHLRETWPAHVPRALAAKALGPGRMSWLGEPLGIAPHSAGLDRWAMDLEADIGGERAHMTLRKAAYVDIGALTDGGGTGLEVAISWRAASVAPLFPVFAGTVRWLRGELTLEGWYLPVGGSLGAAADQLVFRTVARRTARWLLRRLAEAMSAQPGQSRSRR